MAVYAAHKYLVGGLHTHGGDIEYHLDDQPKDLTEVWDDNDDAWQLDRGTEMWVAVDSDGTVVSTCDPATWNELLLEFGPVYDEHALVADDCTAVYA